MVIKNYNAHQQKMLDADLLKINNSMLDIMIAKQFQVNYKNNLDRNGQFCYPKDEELKKTLLTNSGLLDREHFMKSFDTIKICLGLSVLLSISYLIIVQCIPK